MKDHYQRFALDTLFDFVVILGLVAMFSALGVFNDGLSMAWMVGSFGASITLLLARPKSKLSRPYPALVGNPKHFSEGDDPLRGPSTPRPASGNRSIPCPAR